MKHYYFIIILLITFSSCKKEEKQVTNVKFKVELKKLIMDDEATYVDFYNKDKSLNYFVAVPMGKTIDGVKIKSYNELYEKIIYSRDTIYFHCYHYGKYNYDETAINIEIENQIFNEKLKTRQSWFILVYKKDRWDKINIKTDTVKYLE